MTTRSLRFSFLFGLSALGFAGCEDRPSDIDEKVLTQQSALHAQAVIHESGLALGFTIADEGTMSKILGSSGSTADAVVTPAMSGGMPPTSMLRALVGRELTQQMTGLEVTPSMLTTEEQFDESGTELSRLMRERLFVDANFESKENGVAIYLLHAEPTCRPLPQDSDPPGTVPAIDQKCADDFAKVAVRISVKADGDGSRMTVLVGPERLEFVSAIVHSDEIAVEMDLGKAKAASDFIQQQLGDGSPTDTFERLAGKVRGSLKKVGVQKVTAAVAILAALDVAPTSSGSMTMAASNPLIAVTSDGVAKTAELQVAVGATDIATTWDPQGTGAMNNDFHIVTAGLYGKVLLHEDAKQVLLTDVGIGQTKITVRGTPIIDLNLNADSMRRFSGKLTVNAAGISQLEITPKFDLTLAFDYAAIASDFSSPPAATVAHDSYGVTLVNAGAPVIIEEAPSTATFTGGLKMLAGTLTISAASVPAQMVTVGTGKCLSTTDVPPAGSHEILGTLVVSDCL